MSIKEAISSNWKDNARRKIKACDVVIVLCGHKTNTATGVSAELKIAQEEGVDYFLLNGRTGERCVKPAAARSSDKIYDWIWNNLKLLVEGVRQI